MRGINEKIQRVKYEIQEKKRIKRLINNSITQKEELEEKVKKLEKQLKKEVKDVEVLKGMSFQNFFHIIKGDKEEKLEKEKGEMLAAKLKYESALNELKFLEQTILKYRSEINGLGDLEEKYNNVLKEKEQWICNNDCINGEELFKIMEEQGKIKAELKELDEALNAGMEVVNSIEQVQGSLDSAESWGTLDMFGGGMLSTMQKHSYMDEAKRNIEKVQKDLLAYNRELKDIGTTFNVDISLDSFTSFADYFFDGFFVDWSVQEEIKKAQEDVRKFKQDILGLSVSINQKMDLLHEKFNKLEEKRIKFVEMI